MIIDNGSAAHSQTELAMNTHTMVSDIHRNVLKGQDGSVSEISPPFHHRVSNRSSLPRFKPGQRTRLTIHPISYICI